jgi:phenylalanyl-tRNA synthetase beta chain
MRVPISWLKDYVDFTDTPQGLAAKLTFSGLEVEGIETIGCDAPGVVVGEILKVDRHPNADKLTLCTVNFGAGELVVVCGAPNVKVGLKAPFAPSGVTLPNGLTLKKAKIRGVFSEGMLCAPDELGLSKDHAGLLELDAKWAPGTPIAEVLGAPETVLELEVTPNRPDCLSLIGIAREVAALYGTRLRKPELKLVEAGAPVTELTRVAVEDAEGCPRYTARILTGVKIGPSPAWMQKRLELAGVRAINNVVDITNYVMLECGHPLHAFDQTLLTEGRIVVRRARAGEKMKTLDGLERELAATTLVIADAAQPVALAGVMGGGNSEIRDTTATVLLESATFKPADIRTTARRLGISTESSYRFERGVDAATVEWASRRAAMLMGAFAGACCAPGVIDVAVPAAAPRKLRCRFDYVRERTGFDISDEKIRAIFQGLEMSVRELCLGNAESETRPTDSDVVGRVSDPARGAGSPAHKDAESAACEVTIPTFRGDLEREIDLVEEVARIHGLDQVPAPSPRAIVVAGVDDRPAQAVAACRRTLVSLGLRETMNYSFLSEKLLNLFDPAAAPRRVVIPNPVSADHTLLRDSLVPQLVETLGRNHARQVAEAALFEIGRVFWKEETGVSASAASVPLAPRPSAPDPFREEDRLAIGLMGPVGRTGLDKHLPVKGDEIFLWLKGLWEALAGALGLKPEVRDQRSEVSGQKSAGSHQPSALNHVFSCRAAERAWGEPGCTVGLFVAGVEVGALGIVKHSIAREWRLTAPVAVLEAQLAPLLANVFAVPRAAPIAQFPAVRRDMALVAPDALKHEDVVRVVRRAAPPELESVELFDIFHGGNLGMGRKSMAYACTYRAADRTLTDEAANQYHAGVKEAVRRELNVEIREG